MANNDLKENVLLNLRSVTQSIKGGVPFDRLQRDYRDLLGSPIPFRELGYDSLEDFIRDIPDVIALRRNNEGKLMAVGVADASTAHIVSLVSRQKSDLKKKPLRKPPPHGGMRRTLSSRYTFREGPRGAHSRFSSDYNSRSFPRSKTPPISSRFFPSPKSPPISSTSFPRAKTPPVSSRSPPRSKTPPLKARPPSPKAKQSKPQPIVQQSKPRLPPEQVPRRSNYEIAPRFLRQIKRHIQTESDAEVVHSEPLSSPELISPPTPTSTSTSVSSISLNSTEIIPPPISSFPVIPAPVENRQRFQYDALDLTKTAKEFVETYANIRGLVPTYRTVLFGQKTKTKGFVSTLKLGDKSYQSYPEMRPTEELAEEEAARKAMVAIKKEIEDLNYLPETPYSNLDEIRILLSRIEEIVCEKPSGMFANGIVREYEEKFNEKLPSCWQELLKQSSYVEIEELKLQYGKVPDGANIIVRPVKELSSGNQTPSSTSSKLEYTDGDLDSKALKKNLVNISLHKVPDFVIPTGNIWDVYITYVGGWFSARLLDYYDEFLALSEEMSQFYKSRSFSVNDVFEGQVYAACIDDNPNIWHRIIVEEVKEDGQISCYFVDEGDFSYVRKENLQEMSPSFLKLPYQAIHLSLDRFDDYEKYLKNDILEDILLGKTLIAEVKRWYPIPEFFPEIPGIHRTVYCVILYDTSDSSGEDVNLNDLLKKSATEAAVESLNCNLPKLLTTSCAYLSCVTEEGLVYVRLNNHQDCWLEQELEKLSPVFEEASAATMKIPLKTMCAAKYEAGSWHRAIVSESLHASADPEVVEVFFVDFGYADVVGKSEICELKPISELLASVPPQAICSELLNALPSPESQWTPLATEKLMELAPPNQELIIRVISEADEGNLAKVNLYRRNEDSNIISINESLACNPTLFNNSAIFNSETPILPLVKTPSMLPLRQPILHTSSVTSNLSSVIPDVAIPAEEQMARRLGTSVSSEQIEWLNTPDNIRSPDAFEVYKPMTLSLPSVPDKGEYFDVFITMAAHPHNFVVQPLDSCPKLDKLMEEMMNFYSSEENFLEMDFSMLRKNDYYAALHSDGSWYRVRIEQIINDDQVSVAVHFIDFGDFDTVSISRIQPLYQQFKQLPSQAIKASLAGIKPFHTDWDARQCIEFQEMVTEKTFVSVIHSKKIENKDNIPSFFLELTLIDTRDSSNDVYIHELLVEKKIAKLL